MNEIVNKVYGIACSGMGYAQVLSRVDLALENLSSWKNELPSSLQLQDDGKIPDRARLTLHMTHNQVSVPVSYVPQTRR